MDAKKFLEDFGAAYDKAFNAGDAEGCAAAFADDLLLLPPNAPMARGKKAIQDMNQARLDTEPGLTHRVELVEFDLQGDSLYHVGKFTMSDGSAGKFVNIFKIQGDGSWKVVVSMFNSDKP